MEKWFKEILLNTMKGVFQVFLMNVEAVPDIGLDFYIRWIH